MDITPEQFVKRIKKEMRLYQPIHSEKKHLQLNGLLSEIPPGNIDYLSSLNQNKERQGTGFFSYTPLIERIPLIESSNPEVGKGTIIMGVEYLLHFPRSFKDQEKAFSTPTPYGVLGHEEGGTWTYLLSMGLFDGARAHRQVFVNESSSYSLFGKNCKSVFDDFYGKTLEQLVLDFFEKLYAKRNTPKRK